MTARTGAALIAAIMIIPAIPLILGAALPVWLGHRRGRTEQRQRQGNVEHLFHCHRHSRTDQPITRYQAP